MKILSLMALLLTFYVPVTQAGTNGPFTITCTAVCNPGTIGAYQLMEDDINKGLPDADASNYLIGMANASVMSIKGSGSDYANDVDLFVFKVSAGIGADIGDSSLSDIKGNEVRGFGLSPSLMIGLNPGALFDLPEWEYFDMNKIKLFVNFFSIDIGSIAGDEIDGKATNFGVHARYKLIDPIAWAPGKLLHWTGVDIHTGFDYSSLTISTTQTTTESFASGGATASMTGNVVAGAEISTMTIPIEASTGVQLGYILSMYTGLGLDISFGSAKSIANVNTTLTATGGSEADGTLDLGQEGKPTSVAPRYFVGTQFNISLLKLGIQLDKSLSDEAYGINIGLGVTW
jgi:hypothetical protein